MTSNHFVTAGTEKSALTVNVSDMEENNSKKSEAIAEVIKSGPLKVTGNFTLKDVKRNTEDSPSEVWLCRCGRSGNQPYCDNSHKK